MFYHTVIGNTAFDLAIFDILLYNIN